MGSTRFSLTSAPQGLYETSTSQLAPLGSLLCLDDGRMFQYCEVGAGAAAVNGRLYQSVAVIGNHGGTGQALATELTGDRSVNFTPGATAGAENLYAEGYLVIVNDTGAIANAGPTYKVSGHPAITASTAFDLLVADPLWEGIAAASTGALVHHPCKDVIIHPSPPTEMLVGIPPRDHAADAFGWFQVRGIAGCLQDGALTNGNSVDASASVDGSVTVRNATYVANEPLVGHCVSNTADGDVAVIFLTLV